MDNRWLIPLTIICIIGLLALLLLKFIPITQTQSVSPPSHIKNIDVRGMAVEHKGLLYTLNFDQQNQFLKYLNSSLPVSKTDYQNINETLPFSKILIYTFNSPDVEISPIGYKEDNLVFFAPNWNTNSYMIELSGGELKKLLGQTYDP